MADHQLDQLPDLDSIAGDHLLPWRRLWCPTGGSISMEGYGFSNSNRGFLAEPDGLKHEDVLSNCLKRWLDGSRSLVVNREVQLIEIMPHRLDLKIDIPGEAPLCTIVEVKKDENIEAPTSMEKQLFDDYLVNGGQTHGIYLLAWFGNSASRIGGASPEEDLAFLQNQQNALSLHHGMRVEAMVMDCRHRAAKSSSIRKSPVSKTVKKKQITPAKKASRKRAQP